MDLSAEEQKIIEKYRKRKANNLETIEKIKDLAVSVFEGTAGSKLILFGSRARGDFNEDSDWDLLVLLKEKNSFNEAFDKYAFPFVELGYRNGLDVQPQIFSYEEWTKQSITPFYKNVEEDGIVLFEN
ncbi:MAG: nucleotidyltransferase domain-containing protein [Bacteroidales bacterium]|nr:nucleotidyltransferase domain-containing protein [Bacteroidales bacterium]